MHLQCICLKGDIFQIACESTIVIMGKLTLARLGGPIIAGLLFVGGFVVNLTSDLALYNADLNMVGGWQQSLDSAGFMDFMNVVSNIFNPVICAGYVALFWIVSSRKLQIMTFLVWFIFLSWLLTILKSIIHQPRPYWQPNGPQMLQWTCYSQFGCPSGHSMLGFVLMEFVLRFFARGYSTIRKYIVVGYVLVFLLQLLVMFSRVILGMHTFNEVLMGLMIGCFSVAVYYALVEEALLNYMCVLIEKKKRGLQLGLLVGGMALCVLIDLLVFFLPNYDDSLFWDTIQHTKGCEKVKLYKSFQYKCLEDSALIMAAFGLLIALLFMPLPHNLTLPLRYSRLSCKYAAKLGLMLLSAAVPVAAFLNPGWEQIPTDLSGQALIIWGCQNLGFFTAILSLLLVAPWLCEKADLEEYGKTAYALEGEPLGGAGEVELRTSKAQSCL